jgi:hypothetical protein
MAITVCGSCISFGSFDLCSESTGFKFGGTIKAKGGGFIQAPLQSQGSTCGFVAAGKAGPGLIKSIEKFPFAATAENASDVGELSTAGNSGCLCEHAGHSSPTHGFVSGGTAPHPTNTNMDGIHRFSFSAPNNSSDVGELTAGKTDVAGLTGPSHGFTVGGQPGVLNVIEKFSFASSADGSDVGDATSGKLGSAGVSSFDFGYVAGNYHGSSNRIERFSFLSDGNASDVGDLAQCLCGAAGINSVTNGYVVGGKKVPSSGCDFIQKFPFAASTDSTDIGNLSQKRDRPAGSSSEDQGFTLGGCQPGLTAAYDRFPFASDTNASLVGTLQTARKHHSGHQV